MKRALLCSFALIALTACAPQQPTADQIREQTAKATRDAAHDAKAVVQGIADGIKEGVPVNVNKASADRLESLPGIDDARAHRIIANRPYGDATELVKKHVLTKAEYKRIVDRITAQ